MAQRYVVEGEWTGYTSVQQRVVHREVVNAKRAERLRKIHKCVYTDGTALLVRVRPAEHREKVREMRSYSEMLQEAEAAGKAVFVIGVDDCPGIEYEARRA